LGYDLRVDSHSALLFLATGAFTGLLGSLLGVGGGVILVPILTLLLGVPIRGAIAASLVSVIATASASSTVNLEKGLLNIRLGLVLEVATSVGGLGGGLAAALLTQRQLFLIFAATMALMGIVMIIRSKKRNVIANPDAEPGLLGGTVSEGSTTYVYRVKRLPLGLVSSLLAGALSGLLGVGGGIVKVPVLNSFCGIPIRVAAATSAFMIGVTAAASSFVYFGRGDVILPLTSLVALGSLPASLLGAHLSQRVETRALKMFMAALLFVVGAQMAGQAL
jgi:uncharacterized membrane protein YfcA